MADMDLVNEKAAIAAQEAELAQRMVPVTQLEASGWDMGQVKATIAADEAELAKRKAGVSRMTQEPLTAAYDDSLRRKTEAKHKDVATKLQAAEAEFERVKAETTHLDSVSQSAANATVVADRQYSEWLAKKPNPRGYPSQAEMDRWQRERDKRKTILENKVEVSRQARARLEQSRFTRKELGEKVTRLSYEEQDLWGQLKDPNFGTVVTYYRDGVMVPPPAAALSHGPGRP
jgi:hypothetical protein